MPVQIRWRDIFAKYIPPWLSNRPGFETGYRYLWSMIAPLDAAFDTLVQGKLAAFPGVGTPTALPLIGRMRGILRGEGESVDDYSARLQGWLELWRAAGSAEAIAASIQGFMTDHPRVRVITRSGYWITLNEDGTIDRDLQAWDWDSAMPERDDFWSEIWIVVYGGWGTTGPFLDTAGSPTWGEDGYGIGHDVTREAYDAIQGQLAQWKAAHTKIRAVIFTSDNDLFDPSDPSTCPDGTWGTWGSAGEGSRTLGGRNLTTCRYWEPR